MTIADANELFGSWVESPPVSVAVRTLMNAFVSRGPATTTSQAVNDDSASVEQIAARADPRVLPVMRSRDLGLPQAAPVFDLDALRDKNRQRLITNARGAA